MINKIIVIHASEIIRQGVSALIQKHLNIDSIVLESPEGLSNYQKISGHNLVLIADAKLESRQIPSSIEIFRKHNNTKIVLIHTGKEERKCESECDCCFTVDDSSDRIIHLLKPFLNPGNPKANKKNLSGLTEREIDVIKLVATGKTNKDIADTLCISIHTVISHRKNITEKLGIKSISGLTVFAVLNNFIDTNAVD